MPTPADSGEEIKGSTPPHMVVGVGVGSFLDQLDPYFGEPWDGVMLGPYPANEWIDMTAEPTEAFSYDEAGSITSRRPAPMYRCATCGKDTTRRVCISLTPQPGHPNTMSFLGEQCAECQSCARMRVAEGLVPPQPEAAAEAE